jgi:DNA repair protein RecN (Recombination protein N)
MLTSLSISHYALIDQLSVEFSAGLQILTGETGAGKSIIIDALGLLLGARASSDVVRTGAPKAVVEAAFDVSGNKKLQALLEENEIESSDQLMVRREISAKGQNRCLVNDSLISLGLLKQIGELLVDLHGQHEHQSLLRVDTHIDMLDDFGGLEGIVTDVKNAHRILRELTGRLQELREKEQQLREKHELYEFQIQEIDSVAPQPEEEARVESELRILENAERLHSATARLYELLYEGEQSVHDQLVIVRNQLYDLKDNAQVEFSPERLEELRQRQSKLTMLKKKYGGSLEQTLAHRERIGKEVELVEHYDEVIRTLMADVDAQRATCGRLAQRLSVKRAETAKKIDKAIVAELAKLGVQNGRFVTHIDQQEVVLDGSTDGVESAYVTLDKRNVRLHAKGCDRVEFFISTNMGEDVKPLARVASGGEISRIMLALKTILAKSDRLPVLIFDEIDVGVSGRIARAVGLSLKTLSGFHQVIAITHLPQIAGFADTHFMVFKTEEGKRARTSIRRLTESERIREVAKLLSGSEVTDAALKGARELMGVT